MQKRETDTKHGKTLPMCPDHNFNIQISRSRFWSGFGQVVMKLVWSSSGSVSRRGHNYSSSGLKIGKLKTGMQRFGKLSKTFSYLG